MLAASWTRHLTSHAASTHATDSAACEVNHTVLFSILSLTQSRALPGPPIECADPAQDARAATPCSRAITCRQFGKLDLLDQTRSGNGGQELHRLDNGCGSEACCHVSTRKSSVPKSIFNSFRRKSSGARANIQEAKSWLLNEVQYELVPCSWCRSRCIRAAGAEALRQAWVQACSYA